MSELSITRRTLHGVAEHILSAHGRRNGGSIRLFVTVRGFETRPPRADSVALVDAALRRRPGGPPVPLAGTFQQVADALGVPFGMPDPPYPLGSGCSAQDPVVVDRAAVAEFVDAWSRGAQALRLAAARHRVVEREPSLWPEHLDVGLTVGEVDLGVSPGDACFDRPYAYVRPVDAGVAREGAFWNAPYGALRPMNELPDVDAVLDWFESGLRSAPNSPPGPTRRPDPPARPAGPTRPS